MHALEPHPHDQADPMTEAYSRLSRARNDDESGAGSARVLETFTVAGSGTTLGNLLSAALTTYSLGRELCQRVNVLRHGSHEVWPAVEVVMPVLKVRELNALLTQFPNDITSALE